MKYHSALKPLFSVAMIGFHRAQGVEIVGKSGGLQWATWGDVLDNYTAVITYLIFRYMGAMFLTIATCCGYRYQRRGSELPRCAVLTAKDKTTK